MQKLFNVMVMKMDEEQEEGEFCERCQIYADCEYLIKGIPLCPWCYTDLIDKENG